MRLTAYPSGPLRGTVAVPGDKSISHRALLLGALASGTSTIRGLLEGEDVRATWQALGKLGVPIERAGDAVVVHGVGVGGLRAPDDVLDLGNAGTGVRLLMGVLAGHGFAATLTGDASLRRRPMGRVLRPLQQMGVRVSGQDGDRLPLTMTGSDQLMPIAYASPVASAQVKSAVLLAGLHAMGVTEVSEPSPSRDHTETMLAAMGAVIQRGYDAAGRPTVAITGQPELRPFELDVPGDPSSAAFPLAAALLQPGSEVVIRQIGMNPTRTGLIEVLQLMGADIALENAANLAGEAVADLVVRGSALRGIEVPPEMAPSMIDEYPILAVAAAFAEGTTLMQGIGELRVKESDRLQAMADGLTAAGVRAAAGPDWLRVEGGRGVRPQGGNVVDAQHDHRIAMSFAVLGLNAAAPITVDGAETIATSFPGFVELMQLLGARVEAG
ncbi:MAG: 3-phosphoshikimate 1-carboxyvinyltransferase [Geminicoccaceae bacterium]|nr:MAG: 3-phosphoshikimate 1-carboxyvinyltransferase [Geminicoccaceae bacterium]